MIKIEAFFSSVTFRFVGHSFIYSLKMSWYATCENKRCKLNLRQQILLKSEGLVYLGLNCSYIHHQHFFSFIKEGGQNLEVLLPYISQIRKMLNLMSWGKEIKPLT